MYTCYKCNICKIIFIIPTEDVERMEKEGKYIACNFGHKNIVLLNKYDDLRQCMEEQHIYKRDKGSIKQIK